MSFTSDVSGREGLGFLGSNQLPIDLNPSRDLYMRDLKTEALVEQKALSTFSIQITTSKANLLP